MVIYSLEINLNQKLDVLEQSKIFVCLDSSQDYIRATADPLKHGGGGMMVRGLTAEDWLKLGHVTGNDPNTAAGLHQGD